jgi:UDP-GlcNAc:undecaprenyl-phosphate GlcNAc-1-phosphate transferase
LLAWYISGVGITEFALPGGALITFGPLSVIVLTVARYLMFTNAINRFDGISGLATGMSSIGFFTIALLLSIVVFQYYPDMSAERFALLQ